ncbi:MAG: hypothetical protein ABIV51_03690 [Saprospiraceae bacterium]
MAEKHFYLKDLHFDLNVWRNELNFCEDELKIFNHYLEDLVNRYTDQEMLAQLEHFQNQFIRQREVLDEIKHAIKAKDHYFAKYAESHPIAVDHVYFKDHTDLRENMDQFTKIYSEMKMEFRRFLAKYM